MTLVPLFFVEQQITVMVNQYRVKAQIRDVDSVTVPDERLDFQVAASMAVALDGEELSCGDVVFRHQ